MKIIIDAFNLIFAWGWMPSHEGPRAAEIAQNRLLQRLRTMIPAQHRKQVTIVFDAKSESAEKRPVPYGNHSDGFQLLFAHQYPDADSMIEELITTESAPQHLIVVSSDHRIRAAAVRRGATSIPSQAWLDQIPILFPNNRSATTDTLGAPKTSAKDQAVEQLDGTDWLAEFGLNENSPEHSGGLNQPANRNPPNADDSFGLSPFPPGYGEDLLDEF